MRPAFTSLRLPNKAKLFLVAALLIALATITFGAKSQFPDTPAQISIAPAQERNSEQEGIEALLLTLRPTGFETSEIKTAKGRFLLVVDNRSGTADIDLRLDSKSGERVHGVRVPKELSSWSDVLDLHPGEYVLTEATHPEWVCRIVVTAK